MKEKISEKSKILRDAQQEKFKIQEEISGRVFELLNFKIGFYLKFA